MRITGLPTTLDISAPAKRVVADAPHAFPCRRCLTDAEPGEALLLLSYDPWTVDSPYRQPGPVFVHERACTTAVTTSLPEQQRRRLLSVRAFDGTGMARQACVVPGEELDLDRVLADPDVSFVHLHNAGPGCFAARVDR
jgi:hypothetical protein